MRFCKRGSLIVRFAPKATKLLRRHEMTRWAINGLMHCNMIGGTQTERPPHGGLSEIQFSVLGGYKPDRVFLRAGRRSA